MPDGWITAAGIVFEILTGVKNRMEKPDTIYPVGLFHRFVKPSQKWLDTIEKTRESERIIREKFPTEAEQIKASCARIASELPQGFQLPDVSEDPRLFCASVMTIRGPESQKKTQRLVRELARLIDFLSLKAPLPDNEAALLDLWTSANRLEPGIETYLPAHFRTAADPVPFVRAGTLEDRKTSGPLRKSAPVQEISELTGRLLSWLKTPGLSWELRAFTAHHLLAYIHPFAEGNGHTARLLCLGLLSSLYGPLTLTSTLREMIRYRWFLFESIHEDIELDGDMCPACCDMSLLLIRGQERILEDML